MKYVAINVNKETKMAKVYGKGGESMEFYAGIHGNAEEMEQYRNSIRTRLTRFIEDYGYINWGSAQSKSTETREETSLQTEYAYLRNVYFVNSGLQKTYEEIANRILLKCENIAMFQKRRNDILEAKSFFKELEKNDDLYISLEFPIACSTSTLENIRTPKTKITISDNRTIISDESSYFLNTVRSAYIRDFSHYTEHEYINFFDDCFLNGMANFADNWENLIKPAVEAEVERLYREKKSSDEIELE